MKLEVATSTYREERKWRSVGTNLSRHIAAELVTFEVHELHSTEVADFGRDSSRELVLVKPQSIQSDTQITKFGWYWPAESAESQRPTTQRGHGSNLSWD